MWVDAVLSHRDAVGSRRPIGEVHAGAFLSGLTRSFF
jgi:hypothetical protein